MIALHNELKEKEKNVQKKHNCIFCDQNFHLLEELQFHYSKEHIYCPECNDLLTDEDALHKHNLREHGGLPKDISKDSSVKEDPADGLTIKKETADGSTIKKEPADGSTIKEEPIDCNNCGTCDACETIHGVVMSVNY